MSLKLMTIGFMLLPLTWANAQFNRDWRTFVDGPSHQQEMTYGVTVDSMGNVYAVGHTSSSEASLQRDILLMKLDRTGNVLWQQTYDGPAGGDDYAWLVTLDPQGNVIVGGDSEGLNSSYDILILEYDSTGQLQWEARYDGPANGFDAGQGGPNLVVNSAGTIYVTGMSYGGSETGYDCVTLAYGPDGTLEWEQRFDAGVGLSEYGAGLALDAAGNIDVGGRWRDVGDDGFLALEYSPAGNLLWASRHSFAADAWVLVYGMTIDRSSNVIAYGLVNYPSSGDDYGVVKWDTQGNFQWARSYDGPPGGTDIPFAAAADDMGNVVITGASQDSLDTVAATVMYDANGTLLWSDRYQGTDRYWGGDTFSYTIAIDAAGTILVGGSAYSGPLSGHDGFIMEYSPDGQRLDLELIDDPLHAEDFLGAIGFDEYGALYAVGYGMGENLTLDAFVVKYGAPRSLGMGHMN